jgi:hypothetical protein
MLSLMGEDLEDNLCDILVNVISQRLFAPWMDADKLS